MRIAIFGAGALGGYLGARLVEAGEEVALIARGAHLSTIQQRGLTISSQQGNYVAHPAVATDKPSEVGNVDVVVVSVKAWQVPAVPYAIAPMMGPETFVVPIQNGVEAPSQLVEKLGEHAVIGGCIQIVAQLLNPGAILHVTPAANMSIGELNNSRSQRVDLFQQTLINAKINCSIPDNIHAAIWTKLLYIAATSGVGAITRAPFGAWRTLPETRALAHDIMEEVFSIATARGIPLPESVVSTMMATADGFPAESTTSMQRDIMEGRPSELEFINGSIVRLGKLAGVSTPANDFVYHCLVLQESTARASL